MCEQKNAWKSWPTLLTTAFPDECSPRSEHDGREQLYPKGHVRREEPAFPGSCGPTEIISPSEIGFTFLLFDPVDLFPFPEIRVVQFLFRCSPPEKDESVSKNDDGDGMR